MPSKHDAIVIGTGQSGPALAARLAGAGMNVAIVERDRFGGTCVNTTVLISASGTRARARRSIARRCSAAVGGEPVFNGLAAAGI